RLQLPLEPGLVEPGGGDRRASVRDPRGQHLKPAAASLGERENLAADCDLVLPAELGDAQLLDRLLVAKGPMGEQIADRRETQPPQLFFHRRPNTGERLYRSRERFSAGKQGRPRPRVRLLAGKSDDGHSTSSNQKKPTVPGPAWVPTTAPSVVTTSISACGRS